MKIISKNILFSASLFLIFMFSGCNKKTEEIKSEKIPEILLVSDENRTHTWYYFTPSGFKKTDLAQNAPQTKKNPWIKAIRISSAGNSSALNEEITAYAVVNRLGLLTFENEQITLSHDSNFFDERTAGNLVFQNSAPVFSVYKSSFFNESNSDSDSDSLFLIHFEPSAGIFYPLVNTSNLTDIPNSEVTDFFWDGYNWTCSIKSKNDGKYSFDYFYWQSGSNLLDLKPTNASSNITISRVNQNEFRKLKSDKPYSEAPQRIKNLTENLAQKKSFLINIKTAGGASPQKYFNQVRNSAFEEKYLNATAILSKSWSAVLFEDGTLYLEGALNGKYILRNGKTVALRLPKLPAGFIYSDFVISGTTLYAAWEENFFYETSRSGFISVNLDKTLYSELQ